MEDVGKTGKYWVAYRYFVHCTGLDFVDMVKIIGLYSVPENADVSLVELSVQKKWNEFDIGNFAQEIENTDRSFWQAPFGEVYLNETGTQVIGDYFKEPDKNSKFTRLIFFIYFLDVTKPLDTPFGKINLLPKTSQPLRISSQISFEAPE